jgi:C4-dicarboxylate-specific signal transduction histidine kinase
MPAVAGYGVAILSVGAAVTITLLSKEVFQSTPNALFFCAIIFASWLGGFGPGILASVLSTLSVKFYFTPPFHTLAITLAEMPRFAIFLFAGAFISWLSGEQRRAEAALRQARDELEHKVFERTAALRETNEHLETEITERKRVESELIRLNRALRVRSACNQAVTRSGDEAELLDRVCRAVVEVGGYRLAWIGYAQADEGKTVRPMARAGEAGGYVDEIGATWAEDELGMGPTGMAIRTGQPMTCNRISSDPRLVPWRTQASAHGLRSSAALPLMADGRALGALVVYADEPEAFDEKETDLLLQAANDLAHGIMLSRAKIERGRMQETLEKTQSELARVARATTVGELTASIAHEVNQPLAAVVTNANAGLRWLASEPPNLDEARQAVRRIVRDGNRASDVIARIRALLKKGDSARGPLNINETVGQIVALAQAEMFRRNVVLQTDLATGLPRIMADHVQLQQVLLNLITNALDALSAVTDRPRVLEIRTESAGPSSVRVAVRDTGIGFDPEQAERLFEAFFTSKPNGLGMGLSISRSIVEAHGGRLWATPNDGPGVTFQFTLPAGNGDTP